MTTASNCWTVSIGRACLLARHDVLWIPGSPTERIDLAREIVTVAERSGDDERVAEGNLLLANALLESGSAAFESALDETLRVLDRLGQPRHRYTAATRRAAILLLRGDLEAADAAIEDAADLGSWIREPDAENVRMSQRLELVRARAVPRPRSRAAGGASRRRRRVVPRRRRRGVPATRCRGVPRRAQGRAE